MLCQLSYGGRAGRPARPTRVPDGPPSPGTGSRTDPEGASDCGPDGKGTCQINAYSVAPWVIPGLIPPPAIHIVKPRLW